jgi:hypothetical protein
VTKASRNRGVFYAAILVYPRLRRGQRVLETSKGGLESSMTDFGDGLRVICLKHGHDR